MRPSLKRNAELRLILVQSLLLVRGQQKVQRRIRKAALFKSTCFDDIQLAAEVWTLRPFIILSVFKEPRYGKKW